MSGHGHPLAHCGSSLPEILRSPNPLLRFVPPIRERLRKPGEAQLYTSANTESWPNFWSTSPANRCRRSSASCCGARSARTKMHIFGEPKEFPHRPCRDGDDAARSRTVWFAVHRLGTIGKRASTVPPAFLKGLLEKSVPTCKPTTSRHGSATPRISGRASAARVAVERLRKLALPHSTLCCIARCRHTAPAAASPAPLPD